jgi:hypothetical protein
MTGRSSGRRLLAVQAALAGATGVLGLLTLAIPDWIEAAFRIDPDGGGGSLEWVIVTGLLLASLTAGQRAWARWRRLSRA